MTVADFLSQINKKSPPAQAAEITRFESAIGQALPDDYRSFLVACNGGHVGGRLWFRGPTPDGRTADAGVHHVGGFRPEKHFSLPWHYEVAGAHLPTQIIWIMDDPFGNAICLGISGDAWGQVYFWNHDRGPESPNWDHRVETSANTRLLARSFTEFVAGLAPRRDD